MTIENREDFQDWYSESGRRDAGKNPTDHTARKLRRKQVPRREPVDWILGDFMPQGQQIKSFADFIRAYEPQVSPNGKEPTPSDGG